MANRTDNDIKSLYEQTHALLGQGRIKDSLVLMKRNSAGIGDLGQRIESIESTYSLLTKYFLDGVRDESRPRMLDELRLQLLDIADRIDRHRRLPADTALYYAEARMLSYRPRSLQSLLEDYTSLNEKVTLKNQLGAPDTSEMKNREALLEKIFNHIWTLGYDGRDDLKLVRDHILASEQEDPILAFQMVSALLMALLTWYDRDKLTTLLSVYESSATEQLAARSLTALVMVLARHRERIAPNRKLMARLETLKDSLLTYRRLLETVRTIIRTRDTERIVTKMRSEVLPGMMKLGPDIVKKMKETSEDGGIDSIEANPEWEEMLEKSGLAEKIRELTEMQLEGADVMMVAFSNLKGFPFFARMSNWFLPFTTDLSMLHEGAAAEIIESDAGGTNRLLESDGIMCDSDKFSFLFGLASMPESRRQAMSMQLDAQRRQIEEAGDETNPASGRPAYDIETEKYIRDLYRFFKLFPKNNEFADPFLTPLDFQNLPVVSEILNETEVLELIAAFYFKRGYYREALPMLRQLTDERGDDPHLWEKLGYTLERTGDVSEEALSCYMKAELLSPDSRWLAKRIGKAYASAGRWRLAEDYLSRAYGDSENVSELIELAEVKRLSGHMEQAARDLYKANYLEPDNGDVRFALARMEMERGDFDKGLKFALPKAGQNVSPAQFRLLGHIYLLKGEYRHAAESYARTILPEHKRREWKKAILEDWPLLDSLGADREEFELVLDSLV